MTFIDNGIFGFDISTYQDASTTSQVVDFQKMKDYGASFVIIRVGQGNFIDQDWQVHKDNSRGILPRAPYWFYDPIREPVAQADLLMSAIGTEIFEGRIWLDLEFAWSGAYSAPKYWRAFRNRIKSRGFLFGIYTRKTWWDDKVTLAEALDFSIDPFWVAQYNSVLDFIPKGVSHPMLWQDGTPSIGHDAGVESVEIDRDKWNSHFDFSAEWNAIPVPPPIGGLMYFKVVSTSSNLRSSAGVSDNDLGDGNDNNVIFNDIVETLDYNVLISGVTWREVVRWWRNNIEKNLPASPTGKVWVAEKTGSTVWLISTIFTPPPSPSGDYILHYNADGTVKKYVPE